MCETNINRPSPQSFNSTDRKICQTQLEVSEYKNGSVTSTSAEKAVVNRKNNHKEVPRETPPNSIPQYLQVKTLSHLGIQDI